MKPLILEFLLLGLVSIACGHQDEVAKGEGLISQQLADNDDVSASGYREHRADKGPKSPLIPEILQTKQERGAKYSPVSTKGDMDTEETKFSNVREERGSSKVREERGSSKVREERGSSKVREERGSSKVREERGSSKVREERGSSKIREERGSSKIREERGSSKIREERGSKI